MSIIKINKSEDVTSKLAFKPMPKFNNLCIGYLDNIEVTESLIAEDSAWEFKGKTVPRLAFYYTQWKENPTDVDRFYGKAEMLIASTDKDGKPIDEGELSDYYNNLWKRIKHTFDQFKGSDNFKDMAFDVEFDPSDPIDKRIADMKKFFNNVADAFNKGTDGKPVYKDTLVAMKLIKTKNKSKKGTIYYTLELPRFVGKGFIQAVKINDAKINTTLEFGSNETVDLTAPVVTTGGGANAAINTDLPDDIAQQLGIAQ